MTACLAAGLAPAQAQEAETPLSLMDTSLQLRAETRDAATRGDWETARRTNAAALVLQPGHPGLLRNQILIEANAGSPSLLLNALEDLAVAGLTFDLDQSEVITGLADRYPVRYGAVSQRLAENAEPVGSAEIHLTANLPDNLIEGVAVDIETERVFLSSVSERAIYMFQHGSTEPEVFADREDGLGSVFALVADPRNLVLYAASGVVAQTPLEDGEEPGTAIFAFDLSTGDLIARHTIEGAVRFADLTVRDGVLYASDAEAPRIYRLNGPNGQLQLFIEDNRFTSLQGVALSAGSVWVADYALGIWKINPGTGQAVLASLTESGESLIGLDGLATGLDGTLYAVRNGTNPMGVLRFEMSNQGDLIDVKPILTRHDAFGTHGEPTLLHILDGRAFLMANAQWPLFPEDGSEPEAERSNPIVLTWRVEEPQ